MQSMDWQTLVARRVKKDPPDKGGWHAFLTSWVAADILNPVMAGFFNASCDKAMFGWPCDETIEKLRDQFAKETDPAKQKQIVEDLQKYWVDHPTHVNRRPVVLRRSPAHHRRRQPDGAGAGVLERDEEVGRTEGGRNGDPSLPRHLGQLEGLL